MQQPISDNLSKSVAITDRPIDTQHVLAQVQSAQAGAVLLFVGTTREYTSGRRTMSLDYECYPEMALQKLNELVGESQIRWDLVAVAIVHRIGHLELGEASIAVAVSSAHRCDAFEAGQWLMDEIKKVVPIWKQENWADGTSEWVHPGLENTTDPPVSEGSR